MKGTAFPSSGFPQRATSAAHERVLHSPGDTHEAFFYSSPENDPLIPLRGSTLPSCDVKEH